MVKKMQRYFIKSKQIQNDLIYINNSDFHHMKNVMRMNINDKVEVCDEFENLSISEIFEINKDNIVLKIIKKINSNVELPTNITIALGLTRNTKLEEVLRRIVELGASSFIPIEMKRSVIRIKDKNTSRQLRMEMIVKEAAEQSKRTRLLEVKEPIKLENLVNHLIEYDLLVYAYEDLSSNSKAIFKNIIPSFIGKRVLIIIGPEGGFAPEEVFLLNSKGFIAIGLGPRILRLETAPLYIMSAISYELEL